MASSTSTLQTCWTRSCRSSVRPFTANQWICSRGSNGQCFCRLKRMFDSKKKKEEAIFTFILAFNSLFSKAGSCFFWIVFNNFLNDHIFLFFSTVLQMLSNSSITISSISHLLQSSHFIIIMSDNIIITNGFVFSLIADQEVLQEWDIKDKKGCSNWISVCLTQCGNYRNQFSLLWCLHKLQKLSLWTDGFITTLRWPSHLFQSSTDQVVMTVSLHISFLRGMVHIALLKKCDP